MPLTEAAHDAAARALFALIYGDSCKDDPGFPEAVWAEMTEGQRRQYRRQAEVALAAATSVS